MADTHMYEGGEEALPEEQHESGGIALFLSRLFIIFGGTFPFIPQYIHIWRSQDASGFSPFISCIVVVSSILRVAYWFGHWFDNSLLFQAILMIFVMFILIELCVRVNKSYEERYGLPAHESHFFDFNFSEFWMWTDLSSYIQVSFCILALSVVYTSCLQGYPYFIEPIGYLALILESTLAIPQIISNYQRSSTEGMSIVMVVLWTVGDLVKGFFFLRTAAPMPFVICAGIQLLGDAILFIQTAIYR